MPVFQQGELNTAALKANDTYIVVQTPASTSIQGVETGIVGLVGTASWGPFNVPKRFGSPAAAVRTFGQAKNKSNDMPSDIALQFAQRVPTVVGVRVGDGTQAKATKALVSASRGTVTIGGTFVAGNTVMVTLAGVAYTYTVVAADVNLAGVAASVANLLNGNRGFRALATARVSAEVITIVALANNNAITLAASANPGTAGNITATASGATLANGGADLGTFNALYHGTDGNLIKHEFTPNVNSTGAAPKWDLTLVLNGAVPTSELFTGLNEATISAEIVSALANGQGPTRGPSVIARFTAGAVGNVAPVAEGTFAGGANGDAALTSSQQLGTDQAIPRTGMYALKDNGVQVMCLCGNTDSTTWVAQLGFAKKIGSLVVLSMPANLSTEQAIALKKSAGIANEYAAMIKDYCQYLDTVNSVYRLVPPAPFAVARIASLTPEQSPGNKPVESVVATERTIADQPYDLDEIGQLTAAGILFITNPVPAGNFFGLRHGLNTSSNSAINGIEWPRMTNFIAYSLVGAFGEFIDQNQTTRKDDPVRAAAKKKLLNFFNDLKRDGYIEDFKVNMEYSEAGETPNTKQSVRDGFMKAVVAVQYKSVVRFFLVTLIGGKTVDVQVAAA